MIDKVFTNNNIKKKRYLPFLFLFYIVLLFSLQIGLRYFFPFEDVKDIDESSDIKSLNLYSMTLFYIIGAIFEEIKYRLLLTNFNFKFILISMSVFISSILFQIIEVKVYYLYAENVFSVLRYFGLFTFLSAFIYVIQYKIFLQYQNNVKRIFERNFNVIVITQILLFAIWHVLFSGQLKHDSYITIVIVQLVSAAFFTWIRMNYGIVQSVIVHFTHNFIAILLPALLMEYVLN